MYTYQERSQESRNEELRGIIEDINDACQFMDRNDKDDAIYGPPEKSTIKVNANRNDLLLRAKHRKRNKRIVNKHFLTDENPEVKITDEELMDLLHENILSIGANEIKNKPKTKKRRINEETIPRNEQFQREGQDEKNKKRTFDIEVIDRGGI